MFSDVLKLGKKIYDLGNWREKHRYVVFCGRALLNKRGMERLYRFFQEDELRSRILEDNPFPMEQVTRAFFYAGSTFAGRAALIRSHYRLLTERICPEWALKLGRMGNNSYEIWKSNTEGENWRTILYMAPGLRKEGMLSLAMKYGEKEKDIYQIMFWLSENKQGEPSMYIGALQGPNAVNAKDIIKEVTKRSYRYRTKNLILYMAMALARSLGMKHIYAVTNEGYYAMNHMRLDRKLKTDFGGFWAEVGGTPLPDKRFYELPLVEPRKTMEEVPTRKRAVYRKRFAFLDEVDAEIADNIAKICK